MALMAATPPTTKRNDRHVLIFPFLAKGHTIPLLHLSVALARRGIKVTLITTPGNSPFYHSYLGLPQPGITVTTLPFPERHPSVPAGCESTEQLPSFQHYEPFLHTTKLLDGPFRCALQGLADSDDLPLCVISDLFHWWSYSISSEFGVPWIAFTGMGVFGLSVMKYMFANPPVEMISAGAAGELHIPDTPEEIRLKTSDLPFDVLHHEVSAFKEFLPDLFEAEHNSWGVLVNSVANLEPEQYVSLLESFYRKGFRAWLVGPLALYLRPTPPDVVQEPHHPCLRWLDGKPAGSVLYVSFGTQSDVSDEQLDEVCHGLEMTGYDFIWAVRSATWAPPEGVLERLEEKKQGMIRRDWVPQWDVLVHASTGGLLSHCGWNSVLEAVSTGVPILAWPFVAEQPLNVKYVVDVARFGLRVQTSLDGGVVGREAVCDGVRELMGGEKGEEIRRRVTELRKMAKGALEDGGSSSTTLDQLLHQLQAYSNQANLASSQGLKDKVTSPVR